MTTKWSAMPALDLPNCVNARDLGGLPLADGAMVRVGALLRSDNHDLLTSKGIEAIRNLDVGRILDVRYEWEARKFPSPFTDDPVYQNIPLVGQRPDFDPTAPVDYRPEIDGFPDRIAAAFIAVAEAPAGPVLVHCHAGRDRTGMLVAFVLAVAGATAEVIATDYALSDDAEAETMLLMLAHLNRNHGGVSSYLRKAGVGEAYLRAVRRRLIESSPMGARARPTLL